jgi:hypothetical protein
MLTVNESNEKQHAFMAFQPIAIGTHEVIDGKNMVVVDNTETVIVTYEEVDK